MNKYCQTIIFSDKAYNAIIDETFRKDPIETGGILLGHVLDNGLWVVMEVIPPGIDSVHQYAYFEYDEKFVNYLAESVATKYENKLDLLGLWHRHPGSMDTFSGTDDGTNRIFASLKSCGAISGLVNVDPNFRLTMRHVSNPLQYDIVDFEVGDDLIPKDYFKLRHYPEKGLNPALNFEKKNDWMNIGNLSEQKSNSTNKTSETFKTSRNNIKSQTSIVLFFLSAVLLSFFLLSLKMISPIKLSIIFFVFAVFLGLLLTLISIGILHLINYIKTYHKVPWYQKRKEFYFEENAAIHKIEPNAEQSFEDGKLVYTVITDRHITRQEHTLAYQMIYSGNYINDGSIRIYFIMPDLTDMFTDENKLESEHIKTDECGDKYLEFTTSNMHMNGAATITYLYKWVELYNRYRAGDRSSTLEKL